MSFQKYLIIGNLTKDPELRYTPQGDAVCEVTVACSEKYKDKETTLFMPVTVWRKMAEAVAAHLSQGSKVFVEGRLTEQRWEKDGQKHSKLKLQAQTVKFLSPSRKGKTEDQSLDDQLADAYAAGGSGELEPF